MKAFSDLNLDGKRSASRSKKLCLATSAAALVFWMNTLMFAAATLSPIDNPAAVGAYVVAPFILALPFTLFNSGLVHDLWHKGCNYDLNLAMRKLLVYVVLAICVAVGWYAAIQSSDIVKYTGIFWLNWTVFVPPAIIGSASAMWITVRSAAG